MLCEGGDVKMSLEENARSFPSLERSGWTEDQREADCRDWRLLVGGRGRGEGAWRLTLGFPPRIIRAVVDGVRAALRGALKPPLGEESLVRVGLDPNPGNNLRRVSCMNK